MVRSLYLLTQHKKNPPVNSHKSDIKGLSKGACMIYYTELVSPRDLDYEYFLKYAHYYLFWREN